MLFVRLGGQGTLVNEVLWDLWLFPFGALVIRSGSIPRILGILLIVNGVAYVVASLVGLLWPAWSSAVNRAALVPELGEVWIMLWLLIKGAGVARPAVTAS
jgi:hypothetical protein